MKRIRTTLAVLALGFLAAAAAAGSEIPREGEGLKEIDWASFFPPGDAWKKEDQVFVFNNHAEPKTLDPHIMTGVPEHTLATGLFEGLVTHHPATLQPLPGVAEWWEISADGLTYTFHLRADAKWSNGEPVTAEDFRWSWERALSPALASQYADMLYAIDGAEAFNKGEAKDFSKVGVEVVDPRTLRVRLRSPTPYFLDLVAFETLMPVHRATVEKWGDAWTKPEHFVGNGPFVLSAWKPRDAVEMTPNPHWWNRGIVRLRLIRARALDDVNTSLSEYLAGGVDWVRSVPAPRIEEVQTHPDYYVSPFLGIYFFRFNVTGKPLDDPRVRKALNMAVNKQEVCEKVLKAGQIPAMGVVPPGLEGYPQLEGLPYDPKRAKALLAEAGYEGGRGFPEVQLLYNNDESHKMVCEAIAAMWRETLGIRVELRQKEWQVYLRDQQTMDYQIARAGWIGDYADPNTFLDMFVTGRGNNETGWSNAGYDRLIAAAATERDHTKRMALFQEAERILCVEDPPILPIYYYVNQGLLRPRVKGWHENIRDVHPFQYLWLDGPAPGGK